MKQIVYIAGPYRACDKRTEKQNTEFAELVGRMAQSRGLAPVVPHSSIYRGVYGDDSNPIERTQGSDSTLAILELVARDPTSELWVIGDDDGQGSLDISHGTQLEVDRWTELRGERHILFLDRKAWMEFVNYDRKLRQKKQVFGEFEITTSEVDLG